MAKSSAPPAPPADVRLPGLDILRGMAALWVFWFHASTIVLGMPDAGGKGYLAVDFFFMLSGYVMARTYEHRFAAGLGPVRFMMMRYRRLWPVMAIGLGIGAPMAAIEMADLATFLPVAAANMLLVPVFIGAILYPLNSAAWSIMAELFANAVHASGLWRISTRALLGLAAALVPVLVWICLKWGNLSIGAAIATGPAALAIAVFGYAIGMAMWRGWRDVPPVAIPGWLTIGAIPALLVVVAALAIEGWWFDVLFAIVIAPLLMAGGLAIRSGGRVTQWLGAISFPLYAVNLPMLHWAHGLHMNPVIGVLLPVALAALIAWFTTPGLRPAPKPALAGRILQPM